MASTLVIVAITYQYTDCRTRHLVRKWICCPHKGDMKSALCWAGNILWHKAGRARRRSVNMSLGHMALKEIDSFCVKLSRAIQTS